MALLDEFLSKLRGTRLGIFGIGVNAAGDGVNLQNDNGTLEVLIGDETAHTNVRMNQLELKDPGSANAVIIGAPTLGGNVTFVMPASDGSPGQYLKTNGSGVLDWDTVAGASNADTTFGIAFDETSGTLAMFTPPTNAMIKEVVIVVTVAAGASTPTIKVGTAADDDKYMEAVDSDLLGVGIYIIRPMVRETTPTAIQAVITAAGQSFDGFIYVTYVVP